MARAPVYAPTPVPNNVIYAFGSDKDVARVLKSTTTTANATLTGVMVGTPVHHAYAANTFITSNITASGDMAWLVNRGGNSEQFMFMDASAGVFYITPTNGGLTIGLAAGAPAPDVASSVLIWASDAGAIAHNTSSLLILEKQDDAYIHFVAPIAGGLLFGDVAQDLAGRLIYTHADDSWEFWMGNTQRLDYKAATFAFQESTTISSTGALTINAFTAGGNIIGAATYNIGSAASPFAELYIGNTNDYLKVVLADSVPTLYGVGGFLRIGDAQVTQHGLNSEDDLMVTGDLEVNATFYPNAQTLGGTITGGSNKMDSMGFIGIKVAASASIALYYSEALTITDDLDHMGASFRPTFGVTGSAFTGSVTGVHALLSSRSTNSQNWTEDVGLRGFHAVPTTFAGSAGTITGAASFYATPVISGAATVLTVTNLYGLYIEAMSLVGNSKLTNQYGIYIGDQAGGATLNYGIYVAGGASGGIIIASADPLILGVAGASTGKMEFDGATSGTVTLTVNTTAGTWAMELPAAVGGAGEQLTDAAGNGVTSWAAAGSRRGLKDVIGLWDRPQGALDRMLNTKVYRFHYKEGMGTRDRATEYVGVMGDEASWAMHYKGGIVNPVNTLGYMVLGFQAVDAQIQRLERELTELKAQVGRS
ncbi:hypothetical protein LCGC14_2110180 [marine sediment metagenome]|uniref:Uncharacterized protein n=1 Tax=marine sediment metagenome TaxID=412755 RepID=A0A0F9H3Q5_9ZZZZ